MVRQNYPLQGGYNIWEGVCYFLGGSFIWGGVLGAKGPGDLPAGYSLSPPAEAFYVNNAFPPRRVMVPRRRRWLQGNSSDFPREVVQRGRDRSCPGPRGCYLPVVVRDVFDESCEVVTPQKSGWEFYRFYFFIFPQCSQSRR